MSEPGIPLAPLSAATDSAAGSIALIAAPVSTLFTSDFGVGIASLAILIRPSVETPPAIVIREPPIVSASLPLVVRVCPPPIETLSLAPIVMVRSPLMCSSQFLFPTMAWLPLTVVPREPLTELV